MMVVVRLCLVLLHTEIIDICPRDGVRAGRVCVPSFWCRFPWPPHRLGFLNQLPRTCAPWPSIRVGSNKTERPSLPAVLV